MTFNLDLPNGLNDENFTEAVLAAQNFLTAFAADEEFMTNLTLAFGRLFDANKALELRQEWGAGSLESLPGIEIRSAEEINGANGAFSIDTNKIYLAQEFITQNSSNSQAITDVLLEEIGHYVDAQINRFDAAGDEGSIFSSLVRGVELTPEELGFLRQEDDNVTIIFR